VQGRELLEAADRASKLGILEDAQLKPVGRSALKTFLASCIEQLGPRDVPGIFRRGHTAFQIHTCFSKPASASEKADFISQLPPFS
jgi:hypothetical protein